MVDLYHQRKRVWRKNQDHQDQDQDQNQNQNKNQNQNHQNQYYKTDLFVVVRIKQQINYGCFWIKRNKINNPTTVNDPIYILVKRGTFAGRLMVFTSSFVTLGRVECWYNVSSIGINKGGFIYISSLSATIEPEIDFK